MLIRLNLNIQARVLKETRDGTVFTVLAPRMSLTDALNRLTDGQGILIGELRIDDGRHITTEQRKKAYATLSDISLWMGEMPESTKEILKYDFISKTGEDYFSFSNCSVTTARLFINYIMDFALEHGIPLTESGIDRTDDIDAYLRSCLKRRKCCICGLAGVIHHEDTIGMGRDRTQYDDSGHLKVCLCNNHHSEAHALGVDGFNQKYHIYGVLYRE